MHGLLIVVDLTKSSERESRLFRKRRLKLEKRTKLDSIKKGIYLIPFENPVPSKKERRLFIVLLGLIRKFNGKARCFQVVEFEPSNDLTKFGNGMWTIKPEGETVVVSNGIDQKDKTI